MDIDYVVDRGVGRTLFLLSLGPRVLVLLFIDLVTSRVSVDLGVMLID